MKMFSKSTELDKQSIFEVILCFFLYLKPTKRCSTRCACSPGGWGGAPAGGMVNITYYLTPS